MHTLKRQFQRLSTPEKILFGSLLLCFLMTLFPWFSQSSITAVPNAAGKYEEIRNFSAYGGIAAVMGWFFLIFILSALSLLFSSIRSKLVEGFLEKRYWFYLFLTGQSLFLLVLTSLIYTSYSLQFTRAGIQYGLVFCIIFNIIAFFASHFYYLQKKKFQAKKQFSKEMQGSIQIEPEDIPVQRAELRRPPEIKKTEAEVAQMSLSDYTES